MPFNGTRNRALLIVCAGVIVTALVAGLASWLVAKNARPTWTAHTAAALQLLPPPPGVEVVKYQSLVESGNAAIAAAQVLQQPANRDAAARQAKVDGKSVTVVASPVKETNVVNVDVTAPSAAGAEAVAQALVAAVAPNAVQVVGPFTVQALNPPAGSATQVVAKPVGVWIVAAIAAALAAAVAIVAWARGRDRSGRDEPVLAGRVSR